MEMFSHFWGSHVYKNQLRVDTNYRPRRVILNSRCFRILEYGSCHGSRIIHELLINNFITYLLLPINKKFWVKVTVDRGGFRRYTERRLGNHDKRKEILL